MSDFGLIDVILQHTTFTWTNFRENASYSRKDWFVISRQWLDFFLSVRLKGLPRPISDLWPLLLETDRPKDGPTPFKFENMWLRHKSLKELVKLWWVEESSTNRSVMSVQQKLNHLKRPSQNMEKI